MKGERVIVNCLSAVLCALPPGVALAVGRFFGWIWYWAIPIRRRVARDNVRRALGRELSVTEQRRVVRRCFTHSALYAIDTLRAPLMTAELSQRLVARDGFESLEAALERGTGAIVVMAHLGSLDMIGFSQAVRGLPMVAVVRQVGWGPVNRFITRERNRCGLQLLPARGSARACLRALANNQVLGIVVDQHMPPQHGIVTEFMGRWASTTWAPAWLAMTSGAPIFPAIIMRQGLSAQHRLRIEPQLTVETPHADRDANIRHNTERIDRIVEGWIREVPGQWMWQHRRWKVADDPSGWDLPHRGN